MAQQPDAAGDKPSLVKRTFRAFSYRDFRLMWMGSFTSTTGTWTQQIAQGWLVYEMTEDPFYLGLVGFLGSLPFILFTLVGGAVADRVDRRKQLLASQYIQMSSAFTLTGLVYFDVIALWHFLVLVFVVGTAQAFGGPAYQALLPNLVDRQDMPNAIAINSTQFNLARMVGPMLAGILLDRVGPTLCFAFNGLSFIAVIISLNLIRVSFTPRKTGRSVMGDIRHGLSYLFDKAALWQLSLMGVITSFCGVPLLTQLPVFAKDIFAGDARTYSYMMTVSAAGSVTGALIYASYSEMKRRGLVTLFLQLVFAAILVGFAFSRLLPLSYVLLFLGGMAMLTLIASINALIQLAVEDEMRGRVMSVFMLSFRGGMPAGDLATGWVASRLSPPLALAINAGLLATAALTFLLSRSEVEKL
ncbi:MAG TPA: MFS transporter [Acidobacteriota bacterium]|nr:MFS transporter [Acidobacteriota bacterium]